jgi:hypothetical protein
MGAYGKIYQSARPNPQEFLMCLTPFWNELSHQRGKQAEKDHLERLAREREEAHPLTPEEQQRIDEIRARIYERFSTDKSKEK